MRHIYIALFSFVFFFGGMLADDNYVKADTNVQFDKASRIRKNLNKAQEAINNRNFSKAKDLLKSVLELDPNNVEAKNLLAKCDSSRSVGSTTNNVTTNYRTNSNSSGSLSDRGRVNYQRTINTSSGVRGNDEYANVKKLSFGWNIFDIDANSCSASFQTGVKLRFGKFNSPFNAFVGANYSLQAYLSGYDYCDYAEVSGIAHHEICVPADFHYNFARLRSCSWYVGAGLSYAFRFAEGDIDTNSTTCAVYPQFGYMREHFDLGLSCKFYISTPFEDSGAVRFGIYGTWYF